MMPNAMLANRSNSNLLPDRNSMIPRINNEGGSKRKLKPHTSLEWDICLNT